MALTFDLTSYIIHLPQSLLTPLWGVNYQLDTNTLRLALRDWEDSEEGMAQPVTHNHNTSVLLGGILYARVLEILSPWTITFEEKASPYVVSLTGSNNNVLEKTNLGTVQILSNNSAGLIGLNEINESTQSTQRLIEGLRPNHTGYGDVYYWNPVTGSDTNDGRTPATACATFAHIHDNLVADYGYDIVLAMPGGSGATVTTENLEITKNYVFLRGPGRNFTIKSLNDSLDNIKITGNGVQVAKVRIGDNPTNTKHAIWTSGDFTALDNITVSNANKGVEIFGATRVSINGLDAQDNNDYGLKIAGGSTRVTIEDAHCGDNGGDGLLIDNAGGDDVSIESGNTFHANGGYGINITAATTGVILHHDNHVFGNTLGDINDLAADTYQEEVVEDGMTTNEVLRVILAALAGKRAGIGTATETYYGRDGVTPRITMTPTDAAGNGLPIVNGAP